jgi:hypothetical protein
MTRSTKKELLKPTQLAEASTNDILFSPPITILPSFTSFIYPTLESIRTDNSPLPQISTVLNDERAHGTVLPPRPQCIFACDHP